jgi:hypothetical protein
MTSQNYQNYGNSQYFALVFAKNIITENFHRGLVLGFLGKIAEKRLFFLEGTSRQKKRFVASLEQENRKNSP